MKFGFAFWHQDDWSVLKKIYEIGFDYAEIYMDFPWHLNVPKRLERELEEYGLEVAFHGPLSDTNLGSPVKEMADAALGVVEKAILNTKHLNPIYFNQHILANKLYERYKEMPPEIYANAKRAIKKMRGLTPNLVIENNTSVKLLSRLEDFTGLDCNVCYDIPHSVRVAESTDVIPQWFDKLGSRIKAAHVHDVRGQDDHLVLGKGSLDFGPIFEQLKKHRVKYMLLETWYRERPDTHSRPEDWKKNLEFCKSFF